MRTLCIIVMSMVAMSAKAGDWPCFAGPDRSGLSTETGLVDTFGDKGPAELWKVDVNQGFGGSAVFDGKVYVMDRKGNAKDEGTDIVMCLDLASGKEQWRESYDAPGDLQYQGTRSTPAVDKDVVVTIGAMGDLRCWDRQQHTLLWKHHLALDWSSDKRPIPNLNIPRWGVAQSALIMGDMVIVAPQAAEVGVVAYDKKTGKISWQSKGIGRMAYQSPLPVTIDKVKQIVMASNEGVAGVDAANGEILWKYKWNCMIPIPTPTDVGDGRLFITAAYKAGCAMIKVSNSGGKWTVKEEFKNRDIESWMHNALMFEKHLYANSTTNGKGLVCFTPDDKILWQSKNGDAGVAFDSGGALLIADKKIFIMDGKTGTLYLVKASPDGYKELSKAKVLDGKGGMVWAPMALSDGKLIVRDQHQIKCLDVKAKK